MTCRARAPLQFGPIGSAAIIADHLGPVNRSQGIALVQGETSVTRFRQIRSLDPAPLTASR
jgi:hypothetical protein